MPLRRSAATLAALSLALLPAVVGAEAPATFKNLQILPKHITKDELKAVMKAQSHALGVDCDYCHEMPDADKDTKNKKIAREMMRMTSEINAKFFKNEYVRVTCDTCHRGKEKPESLGKK
jgi:hypothetical protein